MATYGQDLGSPSHDVSKELHEHESISNDPIRQAQHIPALDSTPDIEPQLHWRTWLVLFAGMFCWAGINGVSATGFWLPYTIGDIGGATIALWFGEGFLVLQVAISPIFGQISDFSATARKWSVISLLLIATVGTIVAGSAKEMYPQAVAGVCIYGCGLVAYGPIAAIVSDVFPRRMRGLTAGCLYASVSVGGMLCNLAGGAFIENHGPGAWRFNLYMSGGLMAIGAGLIFLLYKPLPRVPRPGDMTFGQQLLHFDWVGALLFIIFTLPFMMALIWGGNQYPWKSAACISCLVVAFVALAALAAHQYFIRKDGVFHRGLFANRNAPIAVLAIFIEGVVYITLNIFLGQQIGNLYTNRPVLKGLHFAIILITSSCASIAFGFYSKRFQEVKIPLVASFVAFAACCAGFSQLQPGTPHAVPYILCALVGLAFGAPQGLLITLGQLAVDPALVGLMTTHIIALRSLGGATGAAIATAVFTPKITQFLPEQVARFASNAGVPADLIMPTVQAVLTAAPGTMPTVEGVTPAQIGAAFAGMLQAYANAFAYVYYTIIPFTVAAAIALCFTRSVRSSMNWSIDRAVEKEEDLGVAGAPGHEVHHDNATKA